MLQVHDSAARWRSFFEETCANKISTLAASWPKQISFAIDFAEVQAWDVPFAELILNHPRVTIQNADNIIVIENGRVLEQGTHDELVEKGGTSAQRKLLTL